MKFRRNIAAAAACAAVAVILPQSAFAIDVASSGVAASSFLQSAASNVNSILNTELFTYFAKSVINVAVPAAVFFVAAIYLFSGGNDDDKDKDSEFQSLFGKLGLGDDPASNAPRPKGKSYNLVVTRLNDRYEAVDEVFQNAFDAESGQLQPSGGQAGSQAQAGRRKVLAADKQRAAFGRALFKATKGLVEKDGQASDQKGGAAVVAAVNLASKQLEDDLKACDEKFLEVSKAIRAEVFNDLNDTDKKPFGFALKSSGGKKSELDKLNGEKVQAELTFWKAVAKVLPADRKRELAKDLASDQFPPFGTFDPRSSYGLRYQADGPAADEASPSPTPQGRVFVLTFKGDVQASQVAQLRREVSAVIANANATQGDRVVLELDSGGGTVTGYGFASAQLERLKASGLHLTVCITEVAASGGYLMACVADTILAGPLAAIGSIGVVTEIPNVYERLKKEGVNVNTITAGKYKRTLTLTGQVNQEDVEKTKEDLEAIYALFQEFVGRNRPSLDVASVATGEVWFGKTALARGLVDEIKTPDELLLELVRSGHEVYSVSTQEPTTLGNLLPAPLGSSSPSSLLSVGARALRLAAKEMLLGGGLSPRVGANTGGVVSTNQWLAAGYGQNRGRRAVGAPADNGYGGGYDDFIGGGADDEYLLSGQGGFPRGESTSGGSQFIEDDGYSADKW